MESSASSGNGEGEIYWEVRIILFLEGIVINIY